MDLEQLLDTLNVPAMSGESNRLQFFADLTDYIKALALDQPIVVLLDDLHWADHSSLLFLQFVSLEITSFRILIVGTYRECLRTRNECLSQVVGIIGRQHQTNIIALTGLSTSEVGRLLTSAIGSYAQPQTLSMLMERTEGNPFFVREALTLLTLKSVDGSYGDAIRDTIPVTIRAVIGKQFSTVSVDCMLLLKKAAVIGREFSVQLLAAAVGKSVPELCAILEEAEELRLIDPPKSNIYRFRHVLVQEALYELLSSPDRAKMHLSIVDALKQSVPPAGYATISMIAHHSAKSLPFGRIVETVDYLVQAAAGASRLLAHEEAVGHLQRALEIGGAELGPMVRCDLLLQLGEVQSLSGLWKESRRSYGDAAREARANCDWMRFASAAIGFNGLIASTLPTDQAAVALLQEALESPLAEDGALRLRLLSAIVYALYFLSAEEELERYSQRALEIASRLAEPNLLREAIECSLVSLFRPQHIERRLVAGEELINISELTSNRNAVFRGHLARHAAFLELGRPTDSSTALSQAARFADETKNSRSEWQIALAKSARALSEGNLSQSIEFAETARQKGESVHEPSTLHYNIVQRFQTERVRGMLESMHQATSIGLLQHPDIASYRAAHAAVLADMGDNRQAHSVLTPLAITGFQTLRSDALFLWTCGVLSEATVGCGEPKWVEALYRCMCPFHSRNIVMLSHVAFDGSVEHFLGMLSGALREYDRGVEHFEAALAMNTKMGAVPLVARTQERYAALLLQRDGAGDVARARELLEQAAETMERVGMVGHLARARAVLERLQAGRPSVVPAASEAGPQYLFRREGDYWSVAFEGVLVRLRHTRGLALLAVLLQRPETDVHVFDLVSAVDGAAADSEDRRRPRELLAALARDAGPLADQRARTEYRQRAEELRGELAEAEACHDLGRIARLQEETAQLADELQRIYGRPGRSRVPASACERARINVRNNITYALGLLKTVHAGVWRHMKAAVRTGTFCSYQPERAIPWAF
jgi:tetratricopeptide (TPR) repeat protein